MNFCGWTDHQQLTASQGSIRWPTGKVRWTFMSAPSGVGLIDLLRLAEEACASWAAVCGIEPEYTERAEMAQLRIEAGPIDGPSRILAWTEMPEGQPVIRMRLDNSENWDLRSDSPNAIRLLNVFAHELGHAWGIGHLSKGNLMAPIYDPAISKPQAGDITEGMFRYGPPAAPSGPPPAPLPTDAISLALVMLDRTVIIPTPGFRIVRST